MKLKSAMIRNRGEGTRVGSEEKHGQCQLSTGVASCQTDQCNTLIGSILRRCFLVTRRPIDQAHSAAQVAATATSAECRVARTAATVLKFADRVRVMGMEPERRAFVVRGSRTGGSFALT